MKTYEEWKFKNIFANNKVENDHPDVDPYGEEDWDDEVDESILDDLNIVKTTSVEEIKYYVVKNSIFNKYYPIGYNDMDYTHNQLNGFKFYDDLYYSESINLEINIIRITKKITPEERQEIKDFYINEDNNNKINILINIKEFING